MRKHPTRENCLQKKVLAKGSEISKLFSWAHRVLCHRRAWGRVVHGGRRNQFNRDKNYELSGNGNGGGMNVSIFSVSRICQMSWYLKKLVNRCFKDFFPPLFKRCSGSVLKNRLGLDNLGLIMVLPLLHLTFCHLVT